MQGTLHIIPGKPGIISSDLGRPVTREEIRLTVGGRGRGDPNFANAIHEGEIQL